MNPELHLCMGGSAKLGALAVIHTNVFRQEPHFVGAGWHHVLFAGQFRNPEAVNHVFADEFHDNGPVDRYPHLVGGGYQFSIAVGVFVPELPPPLVADSLNPERFLTLGSGQSNSLAGFELEQHDHRPDTQAQN